MGKERFLKELGLPWEVAELGNAKLDRLRGDGQSEDKKSNPPAEGSSDALEAELEGPQLKEPVTEPGEQHMKIEKGQATPAQIGEIKAEAEAEELARAEAKAVEGTTGYEAGAEGELMEGAGDEAAPESTLFLGSKAADNLEAERATLAAATILPLSLLGTKKGWVWIVVLVCVGIAVYLLLKWYSGKGDVTSPPKLEPQTVEKFMKNF